MKRAPHFSPGSTCTYPSRNSSSNASKIIEVQEKLTRSVLSPARLQEIVKIFGDRRLYENFVLLNRAQLFVGIKLLALYGRQEGGNCLETDADRARVGELALAINSFYGPGLGEPNWPLKDVIVQMAASAELYNSETFVHGLVRTRCLLGPILRDYTAGLKGKNLPPPFERIFTLLNGLNFRDFLDISRHYALSMARAEPNADRDNGGRRDGLCRRNSAQTVCLGQEPEVLS